MSENELECLPLTGYTFYDHCVSSEIYYGYVLSFDIILINKCLFPTRHL